MKQFLMALSICALPIFAQADQNCAYQCLLTAKHADQAVEWLAQPQNFMAIGGYTRALNTDCRSQVLRAGVPVQAEVRDEFGSRTTLVLRVGNQAISSRGPRNQGTFVLTMAGDTVYEVSCTQ